MFQNTKIRLLYINETKQENTNATQCLHSNPPWPCSTLTTDQSPEGRMDPDFQRVGKVAGSAPGSGCISQLGPLVLLSQSL